ncbi:MAG: hypothetical protein EZS28_039103, partial [Streblomastix strix]
MSNYNDQEPPPIRAPPAPPGGTARSSTGGRSARTADVNQYDPPAQAPPKKKAKSASKACKDCCMNKRCKTFIIVMYFVLGPLIFAIGILCLILLFAVKMEDKKPFPALIFAIYCSLGGIVLFLMQFNINWVNQICVFAYSDIHRAFFTIFLGTLVIASYEDVGDFSFIGYIVGGLIIAFGISFIIVGCFDKEWRREQEAKRRQQMRQNGPYANNAPNTMITKDGRQVQAQYSTNPMYNGHNTGRGGTSQDIAYSAAQDPAVQ